jgi:hypothetical protein
MASNDYHFVTTWTFEATPEELTAILADIDGLARWWPSVYLQVKTLEPGDENGVGRRVELLTKGRLPYKLRWQFTVIESDPPFGFVIQAQGDFMGRGVWTLEPRGNGTDVTFDWRIRAEKPLLKRLSFLLKPLFAWNHRWAMQEGERCLREEIQRRRAVLPRRVHAGVL